MKKGKRLQAIDQMVQHRYQHIWDCCCDHGLLGMGFIERDRADIVHFVDIVPNIMAKLAQLLSANYCKSTQRWQIHTQDVRDLPLEQFSKEDSHLIVIAGVGGELCLKMVSALLYKFPNYQLEFLLCPVRHQYALREGLSALGLSLLAEELHKEQKWYYEIIHLVNANSSSVKYLQGKRRRLFPIEATGSLLWQQPSSLHQQYLSNIIGHYQRSLHSLDENHSQFQQVQKMYIAYKKRLESLTLHQQ